LLAFLSAATALFVLVVASGGEGRAAQRKPPRPNVVVIMTDDQTVRDLEVMPQTRRLLAGRGVAFRNSYASYPLCCPSRATYQTGRYAHNHRVLGNRPPRGGYGRLDKRNTLAVWLRRAGYATTHIGKFLNGYGRDVPADVPPGWTEWRGSVDPSTYRMWGYRLNENGTVRQYGRRNVQNPALYQTDVYRAKALDFIRRRSGPKRPFFLSVAFLAPHSEAGRGLAGRGCIVRPAPRHRGLFATKRLPRPPNFNERDLSDKPRYLRGLPLLTPARIDNITRSFRCRQRSLVAVDEAVQAIVATLRATGELGHTYILFTSDNGFFHGQHRVPTGKLLLYEPSSRVPLLLRGPGLPRGRVSRELVANIDIAATIVDVTGARPTRSLDGRSLVPFARRPTRRSRRFLLLETGALSPNGDLDQDTGTVRQGISIPSYQAVRTRRFLYAEYSDGSRELYDFAHDPFQRRSRHADPRYRLTRRALNHALERLRRCRGRACRKAGGRVPRPSRR
jgi:arylsulfatase A-like enzyme